MNHGAVRSGAIGSAFCRGLICAALGWELVTLAAMLLPSNAGPTITALRLGLGFCAIGIVPGVLAAIALGGGRQTMLTLLGQGLALSFALAQGLCVVSLSLHLSSEVLAVGVLSLNSALAVALLLGWRREQQLRVIFPVRERWLLGGILFLAGALYPRGTPLALISYEDFWHLSVLNRMAGSPHPTLGMTFTEPGVPFTHPLPGVTYFMALVSHASGEWPVMVYAKARSFWVFCSVIFCAVTAACLFRQRRAAVFAVVGVMLLIANGTLGETTWHWGQAAPVSHNTDLVIDVAVPGFVAMLLLAMAAPRGKGRAAWLAVIGLAFTVICSHVREGPQLLLYVAAFAVACLVRREFSEARRLVGVAALIVGGLLIYGWWHAGHVPLIDNHVAGRREEIRAAFQSLHGWDWIRHPHGVYPLAVLWDGWHGVLIVLCPLVLAGWGRARAALAVGLIFVGAILLVRIPVLALGAAYFTYDEILMFPVRFFTPFSFLIPGVAIWGWSTAGQRTRWRMPVLLAGAGVIIGLALYPSMMAQAEARWPRLFFDIHGRVLSIWDKEGVMTHAPDIFFGLSILTAITAILLQGRLAATARPGRTHWLAIGALVIVSAVSLDARYRLFSGETAAEPAGLLREPGKALWSAAEVMGNFRVIKTDGTAADVAQGSYPPPAKLIAWLRGWPRPDAVVLANPESEYVLTAFAPQLQLGWSKLRAALVTPYGRIYSESVQATGHGPFFSREWNDRQRWEFCRRMGVDLVVIDPALEGDFVPLLDAAPDRFHPVFAAEQWHVYEVAAGQPGA